MHRAGGGSGGNLKACCGNPHGHAVMQRTMSVGWKSSLSPCALYDLRNKILMTTSNNLPLEVVIMPISLKWLVGTCNLEQLKNELIRTFCTNRLRTLGSLSVSNWVGSQGIFFLVLKIRRFYACPRSLSSVSAFNLYSTSYNLIFLEWHHPNL